MDNEQQPEVQPELTVQPEPPAPEVPVPYIRPSRRKRKRERTPPPGSVPINMSDVRDLDQTALDPVLPPSKIVLRAVDTLGLPKERWDRAKLMAIQELGRYMNMKITGRMLLVTSFDSLEQIQNAYKVAAEIANNPARTPEDRLTAVGMIAKITEAYAKFSDQMMTLAEKTQPVKQQLEKPKNLPPTFAVQVNMAGAQSPSPAPAIPANNGVTITSPIPESPPAQD